MDELDLPIWYATVRAKKDAITTTNENFQKNLYIWKK